MRDDLRLAFRQTVKRPAFAIVVILMMAVGIGASTAVFSVFHEVLMRPLPVPEPNRLVNLSAPGPRGGPTLCNAIGPCEEVFSYPMLVDLQQEQSVFTAIAGHRDFDATVMVDDRAAFQQALLVTGSYFEVLGLNPAVGRLMTAADAPRIDEGSVAVLAYDYWVREFSADPRIVGRTLTVNDRPLTVIGVAPQGFAGTTVGLRPQLFVPLTLRGAMEPILPLSSDDRNFYWIHLFARLRPGVTMAEAEQAINVPFRAILNDVEAPLQTLLTVQALAQFREKSIVLSSGAQGQSAAAINATRPLQMLFAITTLVLLITCVNIANLLIVRGAERSGELAIRASLGASKRNIVRQLMCELIVVGLPGGLLSIPVASAALYGLAAMLPTELAASAQGLDGMAVLFAVLATSGTLGLFGLLPAIQALRTDPGIAMKSQAGRVTGDGDFGRFRSSFAIVQVGLSTVLLVAAGLFTTSLANISRTDTGVHTESITTFRVNPVLNGYDGTRSARLYLEIEEQLAVQPGVHSVAAAGVPVLAGANWQRAIVVEGYENPQGELLISAFNEVSPGFFGTLGIPVVAGRGILDSDHVGSPLVTVVNEEFVRAFALGDHPIGKRIGLSIQSAPDVEIVGVVADSRFREVRTEPGPQLYLAQRQNPNWGVMNFYIRSEIDPHRIVAMVPGLLRTMDPVVPPSNLRTLPDIVRETVYLDRLIGNLSAIFAVLATTLAAMGLYGVLSYSITRRTRELGLRQALGASRRRLMAMVLRQSGVMVVAGVVLGCIGAWFLGRAAEAFLYGVSGTDLEVIVGAVAVLAIATMLAGYIPARRAAGIDPMTALRHD